MKKINFGTLVLLLGCIYVLLQVSILRLDISYLASFPIIVNYLVFFTWLFSLLSLIFNSDNKKSLQFTVIGLLLYLLSNLLIIFHFNLMFLRFI
jgi:uncharacterized membrane protein